MHRRCREEESKSTSRSACRGRRNSDLVTTRQFTNWQGEEGGFARKETGSANVPRDCGCGNSESASSLGDFGRHCLVGNEVVDKEEKEGDVQKAEESHESDG